jgi:hypothetical protein
MSAGIRPVPGWLSFGRIADVPFETCVATLDRWQRTGHAGELRAGPGLLRGPIEYDNATGTCRIQVRLARAPLRPYQRMRLDIDRWSSSTAFELIPCGRVRPTAAYFRAGHLFLDSLIRALPSSRAPIGAGPTPTDHRAGAGMSSGRPEPRQHPEASACTFGAFYTDMRRMNETTNETTQPCKPRPNA